MPNVSPGHPHWPLPFRSLLPNSYPYHSSVAQRSIARPAVNPASRPPVFRPQQDQRTSEPEMGGTPSVYRPRGSPPASTYKPGTLSLARQAVKPFGQGVGQPYSQMAMVQLKLSPRAVQCMRSTFFDASKYADGLQGGYTEVHFTYLDDSEINNPTGQAHLARAGENLHVTFQNGLRTAVTHYFYHKATGTWRRHSYGGAGAPYGNDDHATLKLVQKHAIEFAFPSVSIHVVSKSDVEAQKAEKRLRRKKGRTKKAAGPGLLDELFPSKAKGLSSPALSLPASQLPLVAVEHKPTPQLPVAADVSAPAPASHPVIVSPAPTTLTQSSLGPARIPLPWRWDEDYRVGARSDEDLRALEELRRAGSRLPGWLGR